MKTIVIVTNERQLDILMGRITKHGRSYLLPDDSTVTLSGDLKKDSLRLQQATNYEGGAKLVDFSIYMQREVVKVMGNGHLEEFENDIDIKPSN